MPDSDPQAGVLDDRVPCSDEMCVGIIGPTGICGVCGKAGAAPAAASRPEHPHDDLHSTSPIAEEASPESDEATGASSGSSPPAGSSIDEERVPCLDDMCVGILDGTGTCGTCGKSWRRSG